MADIWKDVHHAIQHAAIVFEDTKSDLGMQVNYPNVHPEDRYPSKDRIYHKLHSACLN